jgi:hypothetical protein
MQGKVFRSWLDHFSGVQQRVRSVYSSDRRWGTVRNLNQITKHFPPSAEQLSADQPLPLVATGRVRIPHLVEIMAIQLTVGLLAPMSGIWRAI